MDEPIEELYFQWLYSQVANPKAQSKSRTYWTLMRQLFTTEYIWFLERDDNRAWDGKDLRYEFLMEMDNPDLHREWREIGCSMLEMLIGLSRRLSFQTDTPVEAWFWHILGNLGIADCSDAVDNFTHKVEDVMERLLFRTYEADGKGGMFPLRRPEKDQRTIEIWYQMCAYILENS